MSKLLQEIRGFAEIVNRRPPPRSPAFLLAQVRPPILQPALPRRRLAITMVEPDGQDIPHPVKIVHVKQAPATAAALLAS